MYLCRWITALIMKFESDIKGTCIRQRIKCSIFYNRVSELLNFDRYVCRVSTKLFSDAVSRTSFIVTCNSTRDHGEFSSLLFSRVIDHCSHQSSAAMEHTSDVGETTSTRDTRATGGVFSINR